MTSSFADESRFARGNTIRYLDGSIGPELHSRDIVVAYLVAVSHEYANSNSLIFNRLNRTLLKILFLSDPGSEIRVSHIWNRFVNELKGGNEPLEDPDNILLPIEKQLVKLSRGHMADLLDFFGEVETLITPRSHASLSVPPIAPESIFGLFLRRCVLQFRNLKFLQLPRLYAQYKMEIENAFSPKEGDTHPDLFATPSLPPPLPSLLDSGHFYDGVREIYSQGLVEDKINLLDFSPNDDPPTLHTTADICQTSLPMAHLYHRYGLNRLALRFLKEGIRLAHELGLRDVSRISSDWLKIYLKLSNQPEGDIKDGNFLLDSMLATKLHKCEAEWKNGQSTKAVTWTSELPKATIMKCLYWDKVGKADMCCLSSQLSLSTLESEGGEWSRLMGHEMARGCNAMIFIAKMLCTQGEYKGALSLLGKLQGICEQNTWLYAQTSEAMLDIQTEKCLLGGDLKEAERLITLLYPFNFILARLKEVELFLIKNKPDEAYTRLSQLSDTKRMKTHIHMRYLLDLSQAILLTNSPALSLTPLSQCISLSQAAKATHYHSSALIHLSHCYLLVHKPEFALRLLRAKLLQIAESGSVLLRGSAHFNLAQSLLMKTKGTLKEEGSEVVNLLTHSLTDFAKCGAVRKQMDVLQLLYQVYDRLGDSFLEEKERATEQFASLHASMQRLRS